MRMHRSIKGSVGVSAGIAWALVDLEKGAGDIFARLLDLSPLIERASYCRKGGRHVRGYVDPRLLSHLKFGQQDR